MEECALANMYKGTTRVYTNGDLTSIIPVRHLLEESLSLVSSESEYGRHLILLPIHMVVKIKQSEKNYL